MPVWPANFGAIRFSSSKGSFSWRPEEGTPRIAENPPRGWPPEPFAARFFIGLAVDGAPPWDIRHVLSLWRDLRTRHLAEKGLPADLGVTLLAQKGSFWISVAAQAEEYDSVELVAIQTTEQENGADFILNMQNIGEQLCRLLKQKRIMLEIQKCGLQRSMFCVTP